MATEVRGYKMYNLYNGGKLGKLPTGNRRFFAQQKRNGDWHVLCYLSFTHVTVSDRVWQGMNPEPVEFTKYRVKETMKGRMKGRTRMAPQFRTIYFAL